MKYNCYLCCEGMGSEWESDWTRLMWRLRLESDLMIGGSGLDLCEGWNLI